MTQGIPPLCSIDNFRQMSVITPSTFDVKKLSVGEFKKLDNGGATVYINYDGKRLRIQAPRLPVPMSASDYQGNRKFNVQFSFRDRASNPKVAAYVKMLEDIDDFVVDQAVKNAGKWLKMPGASKDAVKLFFTPSIRFSKDKDGNPKDYPPTQKIALKERNGAFDAELYDDKRHQIEGVTPMDVLKRGAEVTAINDATGIWVVGNKFGLTWKLHQAMINVPGDGGAAHGFLGVDEDAESVPVVSARGGAGASAAVSAAEEKDLMAAVMPGTDDADEDDEDDVEEDEVVQAPPPPVKKPVAAPAAAAAPAVKKVVKKVAGK
jgi:hypothetical protein